jgi:hypothetical protein
VIIATTMCKLLVVALYSTFTDAVIAAMRNGYENPTYHRMVRLLGRILLGP